MAREGGDVATALAQGWYCDSGCRDPFGERGIEIGRERAAGCGDDTHVDRIAAIAADRPDFAGREDSVEHFLCFEGERADLVEQPCLSDARIAGHGNCAWRAGRDGVESLARPSQLVDATDEPVEESEE